MEKIVHMLSSPASEGPKKATSPKLSSRSLQSGTPICISGKHLSKKSRNYSAPSCGSSVDSKAEDNYISSSTKSQGANLLEAKCERNVKPVFYSPLKNTKNLSDSFLEFPEEVFTWLANMAKEILLDVSISPQDKCVSFLIVHSAHFWILCHI